MLIAIIDMDQRNINGRRFPLALEDKNERIAMFGSIKEIQKIKSDHLLEPCTWWAFDLDAGEAEEV